MSATRLPGPTALRDAYRAVNDRVAAAADRSGRSAEGVVVVAVTKTASPDQIRSLIEMGHTDLGESRVQQLVQRAAQLDEFLARKRTLGGEDGEPAPTVRWHMIGHLQRNKAKPVVPIVKLIHSVDSLRLAEELQSLGARYDPHVTRPSEVLLQVNTAGEEQKFGLAPAAVAHMAEQVESMIHLKLRGLMCMAPYSDNPEDSRGCFARAAELFEEIKTAGAGGDGFNILSMGMTNDFEVAIEEGANVVRIGRGLFGEDEG